MLNAVLGLRTAWRGTLRTHVRTVGSYRGTVYKKYFSPKEIHEYYTRFDKYDTDRNSYLSQVEFNEWIREELDRTYRSPDLDELFNMVDKDGDDQISFDEFMEHIAKRFYKVYSRRELITTFMRFDRNTDGKMDLEELRAALIFLGLDAGNPQIKKIFRKIDTDNDDQITYEEFQSMIQVHVKNLGRIFI